MVRTAAWIPDCIRSGTLAARGKLAPQASYKMHMRMEVEGAAVGGQHHGGTEVPVQGLVAEPERREVLPGEADEQTWLLPLAGAPCPKCYVFRCRSLGIFEAR